MTLIHHYPAGVGAFLDHPVPSGTRILSAAERSGGVSVYVEEGTGPRDRTLHTGFFPTGQPFDAEDTTFIATIRTQFRTDTLEFYWHVYGCVK